MDADEKPDEAAKAKKQVVIVGAGFGGIHLDVLPQHARPQRLAGEHVAELVQHAATLPPGFSLTLNPRCGLK